MKNIEGIDDIEILDLDPVTTVETEKPSQVYVVENGQAKESIVDKLDDIKKGKDIKKNKELEKERKKQEKELKKKQKEQEKYNQKLSRVKNKKFRKIEFFFCLVSIVFILGCCIFYGSRLIYWYKIYNPKGVDDNTVYLADKIEKSEVSMEGPGLYNDGIFNFKGNVDNNYVRFNNMLWRIVNEDNSGITLILDKSINLLPWDLKSLEFSKSDINAYLNDHFLNLLDKEYLTQVTVCEDKIDDLSKITCTVKNSENYVTLMDVSTFYNSIVDEESFMVLSDDIMWLSDSSSDSVWHTNGTNLSKSVGNNYFLVKPVIKLKDNSVYVSGDGTIDNPYTIEKENKVGVGSYIKINDDLWTVYDDTDYLKLSRYESLSDFHAYSTSKLVFDVTDTGSLAEYLNTKYYESLPYKDIIKENTYYVGGYTDSYKDCLKDKVKVKVGLLNLTDLKLTQNDNYYLSTQSISDEKIMSFGEAIKFSNIYMTKGVKPTISIEYNTKFSGGTGTYSDPYILEVNNEKTN